MSKDETDEKSFKGMVKTITVRLKRIETQLTAMRNQTKTFVKERPTMTLALTLLIGFGIVAIACLKANTNRKADQ